MNSWEWPQYFMAFWFGFDTVAAFIKMFKQDKLGKIFALFVGWAAVYGTATIALIYGGFW